MVENPAVLENPQVVFQEHVAVQLFRGSETYTLSQFVSVVEDRRCRKVKVWERSVGTGYPTTSKFVTFSWKSARYICTCKGSKLVSSRTNVDPAIWRRLLTSQESSSALSLPPHIRRRRTLIIIRPRMVDPATCLARRHGQSLRPAQVGVKLGLHKRFHHLSK